MDFLSPNQQFTIAEQILPEQAAEESQQGNRSTMVHPENHKKELICYVEQEYQNQSSNYISLSYKVWHKKFTQLKCSEFFQPLNAAKQMLCVCNANR